MPTYQFEAMDTAGSEVKDTVEAANEEEAQQKIRQMGYFVIKITEVPSTSSAAKAILDKFLRRPQNRRTRPIDKLSTTVLDPFRSLITFFKTPIPPKAGEAKFTSEEKADSEKSMPESARILAYGKEESILDIISSLEADRDVPRQSESSIDIVSQMEILDADPVRKLVNMVFLLAIKDQASDIHYEPFEDKFKMCYRVGGTLYEMVPPPRHLAGEIADRIKAMANLDTAERRRPQYGRIDLNVGGNPAPMRVSVLPTMFGENIAIRVLDRTAVGLDLNRVGMDPALLAQFRAIFHKPNGIVLVTGPTGAGKTTTLYSALSELNEITGKIVTAEDPVEYDIDGIVRCQIHDLTSADALRSILGQDPDIIVVGEIRDHETAQIAVQAALSGRLVLSTLNANDAPSCITRLLGMGLEPTLIAATVKAILAQRLVRRICEDCRTEFEPSPEMLMQLNLRPADAHGKKFYYGQGCERCNNTGHRGRCGVFELVVMTDELRDSISFGASTDQLRTECWGQGMTTLREAGLKALFSGVTTIEEVVRETLLEDGT